MQANYEDEDDIVAGEFKKVPIGQAGEVEVYNVYTNINYAKEKLRKKVIKYFLTTAAIIIFLFITKRYLWDGIVQIFSEENDNNEDYNYNYSSYFNGSYGNDKGIDNPVEHFYITQNLSEIDLDSLSSPQLRKPENIKLIKDLEITLCVEYEKFVHMKIKEAEKDRWEIPKEDILNKDYLKSVDDNTISLSLYSRYLDSKGFYIEFLSNKYVADHDFDHMHDMDVIREEKLDQLDEFSFRIMTSDEEQFYLFNSSNNFIFSDNYINFKSEITSDNIYGFGERVHEFKLGEGLYTIWPQDTLGTRYDKGIGGENLYGHQPIAIHKTKYKNLWLGFVFLNTNDQDVLISKLNNNDFSLEHKTIGGIIDYYIIVDNSPEEVLKNIQFLLGYPTLPPFWSLGNHQSRYGFNSSEQFKNVYKNYKKNEIPIDAMWIDIDAMKQYQTFTVNSNFKDLGSFINKEIHQDGGKFVPIIDLAMSYENQNNTLIRLGKALNIFIKSNYTKKPLLGKVWPGKVVFPDFFNPNISKFWSSGFNIYQASLKFDGIWLDMNEPANLLRDKTCPTEILKEKDLSKDKNIYDFDNLPYIPGYNINNTKRTLSHRGISENALIYGNLTVYDTKPLIGYYEGKTTYNYLYNNLKFRPFILSRSTSIGSGKYVFHWLGDNYSKESNIKYSISGIFNFNIFGIPFTGADICGFYDNASKDLCIRWYNLGAFYPFMRNHNHKKVKNQYPWSFNKINGTYNATIMIKNAINCRYSLLRYMYSQLFLISLNEKGSFFKPVMFEFPEDENSYVDIESKVMIGDAFLLCAFYEVNENDKEFILPNNTCFNRYPIGKSIKSEVQKDNKIKLSGKLDKIHLFLREGFIVPKQNTFDKYILNTMKLREEKLDLIINLDCYKESKGIIFFDNDDRDTIKDKTYYRVELEFENDKLSINTIKNNLSKYNNADHILGNIELWNVNYIFNSKKEEVKDKKYKIEIIYKTEMEKEKDIIEGIYDKENEKIIVNIGKKQKDISLFDIENVLFNF